MYFFHFLGVAILVASFLRRDHWEMHRSWDPERTQTSRPALGRWLFLMVCRGKMISIFVCISKRNEKYACIHLGLLSLCLYVYMCISMSIVWQSFGYVHRKRQSAKKRDACSWKRGLNSNKTWDTSQRVQELWAMSMSEVERTNGTVPWEFDLAAPFFNWNCGFATEVQNLLAEVGLDSCQHVKAGLEARNHE